MKSHRLGVSRRWLVVTPAILFLLFPYPGNAAKPAGSPGGGSGGKPGHSAEQILPARLGMPGGCSFAHAFRMNNGGSAPGNPVVAMQAYCGGVFVPYTWQGGAWQSLGILPPASGGDAMDVSDQSVTGPANQPTVVGWLEANEQGNGGGIFARFPGSGMQLLALLSGDMDWATETVRISDQGGFIVGGNHSEGYYLMLAGRWRFNGSTWDGEILGPGTASAVSDDGSVVVGNTENRATGYSDAWVWIEGQGQLPLGPDTNALDMDATATMVVGFRWPECPTSAPCTRLSQPVYWNLLGANPLEPIDLAAPDNSKSWGRAVAKVNGNWVIVGHSINMKDGIQRAVAWIPKTQGNYGPPIQLAAIDGKPKAWAFATDINRHGQVLGNSQTTRGAEPVIWTLP